MSLKHSPEIEFEQTCRRDCLAHWYLGPQGRRVLQALAEEIARNCSLRFQDSLLEISPVSLLKPEVLDSSAWVVRVGSDRAVLRAEPEWLPLPPDSFACVIVAHACMDGENAPQVVAEAARVLAPEGRLFLLESGVCPGAGRTALAAVLPTGMRRAMHRQWLQQAGLSIRRQAALSVLSGGAPQSLQRILGSVDALGARWLPALGSSVLTIAQRREVMPLSPRARWWSPRMAVRTAGGSQWA